MKKHIKYGKFEREDWHDLTDLRDPVVVDFFECINFMDWTEHQLWIYGSILKPGPSGDIDLVIVGPNRPEQVNFMLETIVACSFAHGVYVDVKYLIRGELFDYSQPTDEWELTRNIYATYKPVITVNKINYEYGVMVGDYWTVEQWHPMKKAFGRLHAPPVRFY